MLTSWHLAWLLREVKECSLSLSNNPLRLAFTIPLRNHKDGLAPPSLFELTSRSQRSFMTAGNRNAVWRPRTRIISVYLLCSLLCNTRKHLFHIFVTKKFHETDKYINAVHRSRTMPVSFLQEPASKSQTIKKNNICSLFPLGSQFKPHKGKDSRDRLKFSRGRAEGRGSSSVVCAAVKEPL